VLRALLGPIPCYPDVARELVRELAGRLRPAVVLEIEVERAAWVQIDPETVGTDPAVRSSNRALRYPFGKPVAVVLPARLNQGAEELVHADSVREV
jgi:hypothetical protein